MCQLSLPALAAVVYVRTSERTPHPVVLFPPLVSTFLPVFSHDTIFAHVHNFPPHFPFINLTQLINDPHLY